MTTEANYVKPSIIANKDYYDKQALFLVFQKMKHIWLANAFISAGCSISNRMSVFVVATLAVSNVRTYIFPSQSAEVNAQPVVRVDDQQEFYKQYMVSSKRFWNSSIENMLYKKILHFGHLHDKLRFVDVRSGCGRLKNR